MDMILMLIGGGIVWLIVWTIYVLLQALLYGALTCATGVSGLYIGSCVNSPEIFSVADIGMTSSGLAAFLLMVAMFKFGARFLEEFRTAFPRVLQPFGGAIK